MIKKKLFFLATLIFVIGMAFLPYTHAATLTSNWQTVNPTIDGSIAAGEWNDAWSTTFYAHDSFHSTDLGVTFWAKNNATYLLLRLQWTDDTLNGDLDILWILFDETNTGNWSNPASGVNNAFYGEMNSTYFKWYDCYCTKTGLAPDASTQDGKAAKTYMVVNYVLEIAIPLASADAEDMQPGAGALIGIAFLIDSGEMTNTYCYPTNTDRTYSTVTFQLASAPTSPSIGISVIGFALLAVASVVALFLLKKKFVTLNF